MIILHHAVVANEPAAPVNPLKNAQDAHRCSLSLSHDTLDWLSKARTAFPVLPPPMGAARGRFSTGAFPVPIERPHLHAAFNK